MTNKEILINIMFAGSFTTNNIGHEIINLYKADNGKFYIYITPYGYVCNTRKNKIKTILLAKSTSANKIEIIAKIDNPKRLISTLANPSKNKSAAEDKNYCTIINEYKKWEKECRIKIKNSKGKIEIDELIKQLKTIENNNIEDNIKYIIQENYIQRFKQKIIKHVEQLKEIYEKNITYNNVPLCEIFSNNFRDEDAIYFGFEAKNIKKPTQPIFFQYDCKNTKEITTFNNRTESNNSNEIIYNFSNVKINNQSRSLYLYQDIKNFKEFVNAIDNESYYSDKTTAFKNAVYKKPKPSLISIMGKQYDELAYSNMFAYFLQDKELFKKFAKKVFNTDLKDLEKLEIRREYENIDLLFITDNHVFVVENKIKSNINGVRYDPYTGDYSNQLIKYYNIIEKNYKTQNRHYYIFKPDYNNISIDNLKSCLSSDTTNTSSKIKEILDNYNIINYSKLFKVLNKERKNKGKMYKDFVNALKLHKCPYNNITEIDMEYKFRKAIHEAKKRT